MILSSGAARSAASYSLVKTNYFVLVQSAREMGSCLAGQFLNTFLDISLARER